MFSHFDVAHLQSQYLGYLLELKKAGHNVEARIEKALDNVESSIEDVKSRVQAVGNQFDTVVNTAEAFPGNVEAAVAQDTQDPQPMTEI